MLFHLAKPCNFCATHVRRVGGGQLARPSRRRYAAFWLLSAWLVFAISGCATLQRDKAVEPCRSAQQSEIERLQRLLAERDAEISRLRAQQKGQVKELEKTTSEAARAEVKLRRFATEADVASRLAEVEVAMDGLKSKGRAALLQSTAQRLLDAASSAFKRGALSEAVELAAQSEQLINMLIENDARPGTQAAPEVPFKIAIALIVKADTSLRRQPRADASVVSTLKQSTPVVARAYQGQWLRVQTEAGDAGWVPAEALEAR